MTGVYIFYTWASCVKEEIGKIKSIIPPHRICLLLASPSSKMLVCGHPPMVAVPLWHTGWEVSPTHTQKLSSSLAGECKPGLSKAPAAFANGQLFTSLIPNISVSHSFIYITNVKQYFEVWRNVHLWSQALECLLSGIEEKQCQNNFLIAVFLCMLCCCDWQP